MAFTAPPTARTIQFSLSINISDTNTCSPGLPTTNITKALGNLSLLPHPFGGQKTPQLLVFVLNVLSSPKLAETTSVNTHHTESLRPEHPETKEWQIHHMPWAALDKEDPGEVN